MKIAVIFLAIFAGTAALNSAWVNRGMPPLMRGILAVLGMAQLLLACAVTISIVGHS